jgi:hypothetical protein
MTSGKAGLWATAISGLVGGSGVGAGISFVGASWKMVGVCAMLSVAIGTLLYTREKRLPLTIAFFQLLKTGRSLPIGFA